MPSAEVNRNSVHLSRLHAAVQAYSEYSVNLCVNSNTSNQTTGLKRLLATAIALIAWFIASQKARAEDLWGHDNLFAWGAAPFDAKNRGPEERAQMLQQLGFKQIAFNWRPKNIPLFETEIETLKTHGIRIIAWALYMVDDPETKVNWKDYKVAQVFKSESSIGEELSLEELLKIFQRHQIQPQLWLNQHPRPPKGASKWESMSGNEVTRAMNEYWREDLPQTAEKQELRIRQEADRIAPLATLAAHYGVKVELYNHNAWFGMIENQLAVIQRLRSRGVDGVGVVYNFDHARDDLHDDTAHFPALWAQIKPYVVAINVSGTVAEPMHLYPSQGDRELEMMRIIEQSGWEGPVGLNTETGGDAELTLGNCLLGLDWLAAELKRPGSAGRRPFPSIQ